MASSSTGKTPPPEPEVAEERRNWLELPREVTASIVSRLATVDILTSVQFVCKAWLEISHDPLVWRRIDMSKVGDLDLEMDLDKMCRSAVDRSSGQLADINIEYFANDDLLKYIADRPNQIRRLRLACCYNNISDAGLVEAIEKLPLLEDLDLTLCPFSVEPLNSIGRCCPNLKSFRLNCQAYRIFHEICISEELEFNREAFAIQTNMPELRYLQVIGNTMTTMGLKAVLDGCSKLESLDLRKCLNLNLDGEVLKRCIREIKCLRRPNDPMTDYEFFSSYDSSELDSFGDDGDDGDCLSQDYDYYGQSDYSTENDSVDNDDYGFSDYEY